MNETKRNDSEQRLCRTCGRMVRVDGYTEYRKGSTQGVAVPHLTFRPHGDCIASSQDVTTANLRAIRAEVTL